MKTNPQPRLFGVVMIAAAMMALFALVLALAAPGPGVQAAPAHSPAFDRGSDDDGTRTREPDETETAEPDETESPEATESPEPRETESPEATESPEPRQTGTASPRSTGTAGPGATGTARPQATGTAVPRATGTAAPANTPGSNPTIPSDNRGSRTFPETGRTLNGRFLGYWEDHGGLAQQGFPISGLMTEVSPLDNKPYTVQYFERAVFEYHPENAGSSFDVLLSQLGTFQYRQKYGDAGAPNQRVNTSNGRLFPETGKTVGGAFRTYWEQHGGLAQQGFPISNEFTEVSALDGKPYTVQYFERAVFEYHPENAGTPFEVLLSQLGTFQYRAKHGQ